MPTLGPGLLGNDATPEERLALLGLTSDILWDAILAGQAARDSATPNHPTVTGGFNCWSESVCRLRELLLPNGWARLNLRGLPLVVSPDGAMAIMVVMNTTAETGTPRNPQTRARGEMTNLVVEINQQLELPGIPAQEPTADEGALLSMFETWALIVHRTAENLLRAELALPSSLNEDNQIIGWRERIPLGEYDMGAASPPPGSQPPPEEDDGPGIDFPVEPTDL